MLYLRYALATIHTVQKNIVVYPAALPSLTSVTQYKRAMLDESAGSCVLGPRCCASTVTTFTTLCTKDMSCTGCKRTCRRPDTTACRCARSLCTLPQSRQLEHPSSPQRSSKRLHQDIKQSCHHPTLPAKHRSNMTNYCVSRLSCPTCMHHQAVKLRTNQRASSLTATNAFLHPITLHAPPPGSHHDNPKQQFSTPQTMRWGGTRLHTEHCSISKTDPYILPLSSHAPHGDGLTTKRRPKP